jgi:hypothetical protein
LNKNIIDWICQFKNRPIEKISGTKCSQGIFENLNVAYRKNKAGYKAAEFIFDQKYVKTNCANSSADAFSIRIRVAFLLQGNSDRSGPPGGVDAFRPYRRRPESAA